MKALLTVLAVLAVLFAANSAAIAAIKVQEVQYQVGSEKFRGYLAFDDAAKEKRPGVVVCHEWWGCNDYAAKRAKDLAEAGYVAFAVDMYGEGKTTTDPKQAGEWAGKLYSDPSVLRERVQAGLELLKKEKTVDTSRLGAIGYCMGGTVALELARTGADLKAVVAFHASTIAAKEAEDEKNIKASVLICNGADDPMVKAEEVKKFHEQMRRAKVDYVYVDYAGAVHAFTNPDADKAGIPGVKYNEKADKRSWQHMVDLFDEVLKNKS